MIIGLGYVAQRLVTAVVSACGGDYEVQSECRKFAASLTIGLDPIGTGLGMVEEISNLWDEAERRDREFHSENGKPVGQL